MSDERDPRERSRQFDLKHSIEALQREIENGALNTSPENKAVYLLLVRVVSILNSEYGTIMRILDQNDKQNLVLFGGEHDEDGGIVDKVDKVFRTFKFIRKMLYAVLMALAVMLATKWVEQNKLNEIIATQKMQTNQVK
jgi:hypothetical protein